jgi:heme/copper-type cytochrome/quinol oxidase subunit 1
MTKFREQAYNLFVVFIALFLIATVFFGTKELDIQLSETYIVFPAYILLGLVVLIFSVFYLLYRVLQKYLWSRYLTWAHIFPTISILSVFSLEKTAFGFMSIDSYETYSGFQKYNQQLLMVQAGGILLCVAQLLFVVNVAGGIIKIQRRKS